jgi:SSS family solute:Na+ symporter
MPQFLERRYNPTCRYVFALALVVGYVLAILGGTLYAGGLALQGMLDGAIAGYDISLTWCIVFFAVTTGAYTIYGGLKSAAWTDFLQVCLLLTAGILIPVLGLQRVGGLGALMNEYPAKFHLFFPPTHERFPVTAVFTGFLTVGIWYSCTSQHMVQRVLGAKDEWHARTGVVGAGFLRIVTPFFFVLPGIIAFKLFPELANDRDMSYLALVKALIPTGLRGLILAGMAAALMSNVSSVLNSASTVATMDLYGKLVRPNADERELVRFGRWSGLVILIVSMLMAFYFSAHRQLSLYEQLQSIFFFIAPPFAVIFTLGLLWRRANATAAVWTIVLGFAFTAFLVFYAFRHIPWLVPYKTYQHPALLAWGFCMATMIVASLLTAPPPAEKTDGIIWNVRYADLPEELKAKYRGWRDWRIWWAVFVLAIWSIFGFFAWFQFGRG